MCLHVCLHLLCVWRHLIKVSFRQTLLRVWPEAAWEIVIMDKITTFPSCNHVLCVFEWTRMCEWEKCEPHYCLACVCYDSSEYNNLPDWFTTHFVSHLYSQTHFYRIIFYILNGSTCLQVGRNVRNDLSYGFALKKLFVLSLRKCSYCINEVMFYLYNVCMGILTLSLFGIFEIKLCQRPHSTENLKRNKVWLQIFQFLEV